MDKLKNIERDLEVQRSSQKTERYDITTESEESTSNEMCKENGQKRTAKGNRSKAKVRGDEAGVLP